MLAGGCWRVCCHKPGQNVTLCDSDSADVTAHNRPLLDEEHAGAQCYTEEQVREFFCLQLCSMAKRLLTIFERINMLI